MIEIIAGFMLFLIVAFAIVKKNKQSNQLFKCSLKVDKQFFSVVVSALSVQDAVVLATELFQQYPNLLLHFVTSIWVGYLNNASEKALFNAGLCNKCYHSFSTCQNCTNYILSCQRNDLISYIKFHIEPEQLKLDSSESVKIGLVEHNVFKKIEV